MSKKHWVRKVGRICILTLWVLFSLRGVCFSLPEVDEVVSGEVAFQYPEPSTLQIDASDKAILNYRSFSIGESESVIINLPTVTNELLNRVLGDSASQILGKLSCNGIFILINQNGIFFGPKAQVDVASMIASTRDITNSDFLDSKYIFGKLSQQQLDSLLINQGAVNIRKGGFGVLIAGAIENQGTIIAPVGTIALAAGDLVRVDISGNGLISVAIDKATASTILDQEGNPITSQIKNTGTLQADDGVVLLKAESATDVFKTAVNLQGYVRANKVVEKDGLIKIVSSGDVNLNATVSADKIEIGDAQEAVPRNVTIEGGSLEANAGGATVLAKNDLTTKADITTNEGDIRLFADYEGDGEGEFSQLAGTLYAKGKGNIYIDGSQTMTLRTIKTDEGAIKIGTQRAPITILGEPYYIHTQGSFEITETEQQASTVVLKTKTGDVLRYNSEGNLTLEAVRGRILDLTSASLIADYIRLIANGFSVNSLAVTTEIYKNMGDIIIRSAQPEDNLVALEGEDINVTYPKTNNLTLKTDLAVITSPGVTIQANQVRIIAKAIGTIESPVTIDAALTYINRVNGNIEIMESLGLGSSIMVRGPPDGFGAIIYNKDTYLILEASRGSVSNTINSSVNAKTLSIIAYENIGTVTDRLYFTAESLSAITSQIGSIYLDSKNTDVYIRGNIAAYGDINVYSKEGKIDALTQTVTVHSETGSINLETTTGNIEIYGTFSAPNGTLRFWTSTFLDFYFSTLISKNGGYIWNPEDLTANHWNLASGDGNWSDAANWTAGVPVAGTHDVYFDTAGKDGNCNNVPAWTSTSSIFSITNYTGTITVTGDLSIGNYTQSAGTFIAPATLTIGHNFTKTGGTFVEGTGSVVFNGGAAWATYDVATTETFYDVTISRTSSWAFGITSGDTMVVSHTLTLTDGFVDTGTIDARGDVVQASTFDGGSAILDFGDNGVAQTYTINGGTGPNLRFDNAADASDAVVFNANGGLYGLNITTNFGANTVPMTYNGYNLTLGAGGYTQAAGTFTAPTTLVINNAGSFTQSAGTFTAPTSLTLDHSFTKTGGTFVEGTGSVVFSGGAAFAGYDVATTETFYDVSISRTSSSWAFGIASGDTMVVSHTLTLTNGVVNTGTMEAQGNVTVASTFDGGSAPLKFSGGNTQTFDLTGATGLFDADITVDKSGGRVNLASALVMDAANQDLTLTNGIFYTAGYDLTVSGSGGVFSNAATLRTQGGETLTITMDTNSGTVEYVGDGDGVADSYNLKETGATDFYNLTIDSTDTGANADSFSANAAAKTIAGTSTITSGTYNANGQTTTITGLTTVNGGTYTASSATQTFNAGLTVSSGTYTGSSGQADVNGTFTQSGGTFTAPTTMTVSGNFAHSSGTFTHSSGTVTLDGTGQTISGSTTFNNLTKTVTSADTLTFTAGTTQTIVGTTTLQGASLQLLSLRSSSSPTRWNIDPQGTRSITYVDVKDSYNTNATVINPSNSTNSYNNINWFGPRVTGTVYSDEGSTALGSVTVGYSSNGGAVSTVSADGSGAYTIDEVIMNSGDTITVFIDGASQDGVTVTTSDASTAITGFNIYQDRLIVRSETATNLTNTHLDTADNSGDADISAIYSVSGGTLTVVSGKELFILTGETFAPGGGVTVTDIDINGTFTMAANSVSVSGNWDATGGSFSSSGTVTFTATSSKNITSNGSSFNNVEFDGTGGIWDAQDATSIGGTLTITKGTFDINGQNLTVTGAFSNTNNGTFRLQGGETTVTISMDTDTGTVEYDGGGTYTSLKAGNSYYNLTFSGAGSWQHASTLDINGDLTISSGILDSNGQNITLAGNWSNSATYTSGSNTVTFDGSGDQSLTTGGTGTGQDFNNLRVDKSGGTLSLATNALDVDGTLRVSGGTFSPSSLATTAGALTVDGGIFTGSSGAVDVNGAVTLSSGTLTAPSGDFTVSGNWSKTGGTFTPGSNTVTFDATSGTQTLNSGGSSFNIISHSEAGILQLTTNALIAGGTFANSAGTFDANGLAATFTGLATLSGGTYTASTATQTFNGGLTISGGTYTGSSGQADVNGTFTQSGGTFTAPTTLTVSGNFAHSSGTFTYGSGTVTLDGTNQTISGSTTFNNLTKTVTSADTLTFTAGTTQTIVGTTTLQGASLQLLSLRSNSSPTRWNIDPQGTRSITYVDVKDSYNTNATVIDPSNSTDSLNNVNWFSSSATETADDDKKWDKPKDEDKDKGEDKPEQYYKEDIFLEEGEDLVNYKEKGKYEKDYPPGEYLTIVLVLEGKVAVSPYDEMGISEEGKVAVSPYDETGIKEDKTVILTAGESTTQQGEVREEEMAPYKEKYKKDYPLGKYLTIVVVLDKTVILTAGESTTQQGEVRKREAGYGFDLTKLEKETEKRHSKKVYLPRKYKTIVTVIEGTFTVTPYDEEGVRYKEEIILHTGEIAFQIGEVK